MTSAPHVEFASVAKRYGHDTVLDDLSLSIDTGECIAFIGHNGAGKTTLMKLLLGLTRPSEGRVRVAGRDPAARGANVLRRQLGYLPESVAFAGGMSGREALRFYARLKREGLREVERLLVQVGLEDAADRRLRTYSKGMRQRLGLAQAMLGSPTLLVMDEPTSGLDPLSRGELYECVETLREGGTTTLISSHSLAEIERRIDRIAVLRQGRLVAFGTLTALREQARAPLRIRVSVAAGTAARVAEQLDAHDHVRQVNDRHVDLQCSATEKMAMLRHVAAVGEAVHDVDVTVPSLDELYHHFNDETPGS